MYKLTLKPPAPVEKEYTLELVNSKVIKSEKKKKHNLALKTENYLKLEKAKTTDNKVQAKDKIRQHKSHFKHTSIYLQIKVNRM